jgi:hypothetical protein
MDASVMFLDCPAYLDEHAAVRCGLPAEVQYRSTMTSTSGPLESATIQCPRRHWFNGPVEFLTWKKAPDLPVHGRPFTRTQSRASRSRAE